MWTSARTVASPLEAQSETMSIPAAVSGIGYYAPYEIREKEPDRDFYGKDMTLTTEQAKRLAAFAKVYDLYNWAIIAELVDRAIENGDFVVINADW